MLFILYLLSTYRRNNINIAHDAVIIVDNAQIHKHKDVYKLIETLKIKVVFLPAYCPELAAIEKAFAMVKYNIK